MFKPKRDMASKLIKELILPSKQRRYELRNNQDFAVPIMKSVHKGLESLSYLGPKIWKSLPLGIKKTEIFPQFKANIKKSGTSKTALTVFAKYTCRMFDLFRLINSVNI